MNKKTKTALPIFLCSFLIALCSFSCTPKNPETEKVTQTPTESETTVVQVQTPSEVRTTETQSQTPSTNLPNLSTQEFTFPPQINFFQYSKSTGSLYDFPNTRIWGWSNTGKIAYSIERHIDGRGGQIINFVVLDLITDEIVFQLNMDSFDHNDATDEALYDFYRATISNAFETHDIIGQRTDFLQFPIRKNNMVYNSQIINVEQKEDEYGFFENLVAKYTVEVTADNKKKIIGIFEPVSRMTSDVYVCGYVLSPFENRALIVVAEEFFAFEGNEVTYRFSGCHLGVGFN
ncbi:MAG: hypothetical protein LBI14_04825 [Treponema sp.]|jgi:hypothetical protein|nr:hypothetical protein [Treponema sp.]